jgi:Amt family ammonium transporter
VGLFAVSTSAGIIGVLHLTLGMRVTEAEELGGLDAHEHGAEAYGIPLTATLGEPLLTK